MVVLGGWRFLMSEVPLLAGPDASGGGGVPHALSALGPAAMQGEQIVFLQMPCFVPHAAGFRRAPVQINNLKTTI